MVHNISQSSEPRALEVKMLFLIKSVSIKKLEMGFPIVPWSDFTRHEQLHATILDKANRRMDDETLFLFFIFFPFTLEIWLKGKNLQGYWIHV